MVGGPFYDAAREALLSSFSGTTSPVDGVIVVRQRPQLEGPEEAASKTIEESSSTGSWTVGSLWLASSEPMRIPRRSRSSIRSG